MQHNKAYMPLTVRGAIFPAARFGSMAAWPLIIAGLFIGGNTSIYLINLGIILFSASVIFQIVTLPVELNASKRALVALEETGILGASEIGDSKKVLSAAAMTYIAGVAASIL
jgi:Zn-dependent membrane protease YugP